MANGSANGLPDKMWLRRGEVRAYLGISEQSFTKLVRSGVLKGMVFKGMKYSYFERGSVVRLGLEASSLNNQASAGKHQEPITKKGTK